MGNKDPLKDFMDRKKHIEEQIRAATAFIDSSELDPPRRNRTIIRTENGYLIVPPKLRSQMLELGKSLKAHYRGVQVELEDVEKRVVELAAETETMLLDHGRISGK